MAAAFLVLMGRLQLEHIRRRYPSATEPVPESRARWATAVVPILIVAVGACIVTAAGRYTLSFWTMAATSVAEMLTVCAVQKIRINRMLNQIRNTDCR